MASGCCLYTQLATELEIPETDSLLHSYLLEHFTLEVNGEPVELNYLGKEPEADAIWCYLEFVQVEIPIEYVIYNAILTQTFEEQVNIVQLYRGNWNKGLMLQRDLLSDRLTVGQ